MAVRRVRLVRHLNACKSALRIHYFSDKMSQSKPFHCDKCDKTLSSKANLIRHKLIHETPQFECLGCKKTFHTEWLLKRHNISHTGDTNHICTVCGARFASSYNLRRHEEDTHLQQKRIKCDICEKTFKRKEQLSVHVLSHSGEKPHKCSKCGKGFVVKRYLKRHSCKKAMDFPPKCRLCGKQFAKAKYLKQHISKHEEPGHQCNICGKRFTWSSSMAKHLKICRV